MNRLLNLLLGILLVVCLTGLSAADRAEKDEKKAAGKNHKVEMLDDEFKPKAITIEEGDTITWVNKGTKTHAAAIGTIREGLGINHLDFKIIFL